MARWRRSGAGAAGEGSVYRITGARRGLAEDVRGRQRRYVISMLVRTAAVLLTFVLWDTSRPIAIATLVLGTVMPYIAVVIANAGRENSPALPSTFITSASRTALPPASHLDTPSNGQHSHTS
ncbi:MULTISPECIES: DUF3099 domain-containing protein [Streptomyces]|uniref:Uncharacterized protein n=2 Tax=Streptomyces TaxID=1883 RepID=A0A1I6S5C4_9ACTN|nr:MULTISPECIES: DUF3099 domain-containing protein [Streptomyces]QKV68136.1 DUF3099 domain-containing protein [Streptomyces harbinensis]SFS72136.1 Protein of unknown function [Streptomyces harbinensis]